MWPGKPTCRSNPKIVVVQAAVDEECQANIVLRAGEPMGVWLDDSTPRFDHYLGLAVAKYGPLHQTVFALIPPGFKHRRYHPQPTVVNVQEWYPFGMGCPAAEWGPIPPCEAYCLQHNYPGTHGKTAPTPAERRQLLDEAEKHRPTYVFQF